MTPFRLSRPRRQLILALVLMTLVVFIGWRAQGAPALLMGGALCALLALVFTLQLRQLERAEERVQGVFRNGPIAAAITHPPDGTILDVNHAFLDLTGYARGELIGRTTLQIGLWRSAEERAEGLRELRLTGALRQREVRFRRKSGAASDGMLFAELIELEGEKRVLLMIQDVSEQRAAARERERLSERLQLATQAAQAGIWDWDLTQDAPAWDEGMWRLYGLRPDDHPNTRTAWESIVHPEDRAKAELERTLALAGTRPYDTEFRIRRPDGEERIVKSYGKVQRDADDRALRFTGISIDVTARRHSERTLRAIVHGTSAAVGEQFFRVLAVELSAALETRYALVAELQHDDQVRVVAVSANGAVLDGFDGDRHDTPWGRVLAGGPQFYASGLREAFPDNPILRELRLESCLGVPLYASSGRPLGVLAVLHDAPLKQSDFARDLLSVFAGRAGAELERLLVEGEWRRTLATLERAEASLRRAQQVGKVGSWERDLSSDELTWSEETYRIIGVDPASFTPTLNTLFERVHPEDVPLLRQAAQESQTRHQPFALDYRVPMADGSIHYVHARADLVLDADGRALRMVGTVHDITERKRTEEQLRLAAGVFESSGEAIVITDAQRRIVTVNSAFSSITGYSADEVAGRTPYSLCAGVRSPERDQEIWDQVERSGYWQGEVWDRRRNGETFPKWLTVSAVRDRDAQVVNYIGIFSDISERKEHEERVRHLAHHDFLTDLPNRMLLNDRLAQSIARAQRAGKQLAIMFLDLDRFKNVNDSLGHSVGDELLREVGRRLKACVRASDTVSRLGGDEFVVLIPEVSDLADVAVAAQKILDTVGRPYSIGGHELVSTPSVGVSVYPSDGQDVETLLRNADAAMYHAKELGRNNYQFFTQDMNARATERLSLERSLRRALERAELRLYYQPQFEVASGRIVGLEALIRWEHPELGLVSPARFMPFAEETGLILPIGEWVLQEACRTNRAWQASGLPAVRVAVNISALQFRQANFLETVQRALADSGLDPRYLELEVTESVIMHDAERVTQSLSQLKAMGLELAIDDFGTGYSSLSYLKRFPIDRLKIDRSFVHDITEDRDDAAITSAIIALTRTLGIKSIAEGVETREQLEFLRAHGCDEVQGYLLSMPLPPEECAARLAEEADPRRLRVA